MAEVLVSKEARKDLVGIHAYIQDELENPNSAKRILEMLKRNISSLTAMPLRGKPLNAILSVHTEYRYLTCEKYRIFYLVDGETVEIVRILHTLQDYVYALFLS